MVRSRLIPAATLAAAIVLVACAGCAGGSGRGAPAGTAGGSNAGGGTASDAPGISAGTGWSRRMEERRLTMENATRGTGAEVTRTPDNRLRLSFSNDIAFNSSGFAVKPPLRSLLDPLAASLVDDPTVRITIVGHTDSSGTEAINNPLSLDRAQSVRDYLAARGVSPTRVETAGRGSREPLADNGSEAGRARNRRVEIFLREPA